jgi:hypothetical protein
MRTKEASLVITRDPCSIFADSNVASSKLPLTIMWDLPSSAAKPMGNKMASLPIYLQVFNEKECEAGA